MEEILRLGRKQVLIERPFTNPDHITIDRVILRTMIDEVHRHIRKQSIQVESSYLHFFPSETRWQKRMIVTQPKKIFDGKVITLVGFFGKQRSPVCPHIAAKIFEMGKIFNEQIRQMPSIYAYYTWLLADEMNYANLVLLAQDEAISAWRKTTPHIFAKNTLSPQYYEYVRIYNGRFCYYPDTRRQSLKLCRVKYWDYRDPETWHAVRELGPK